MKIDSIKQYKDLIGVFKTHEYDMAEELWGYKDFICFYENSDYYIDEVIGLIEDESINRVQQRVIIYNMQRLSLKNYMRLYNSVYSLYKKGSIDRETFLLTIYPVFGKQNMIIKNYEDELVSNGIKKLLSDTTLVECHKKFKKLLSGKTWRKNKEFYKNN